jgi:hypothetical protein
MSCPIHKDSIVSLFEEQAVEDRKVASLIQRVQWKIERAISWLQRKFRVLLVRRGKAERPFKLWAYRILGRFKETPPL